MSESKNKKIKDAEDLSKALDDIQDKIEKKLKEIFRKLKNPSK